jgi:murein DD-endopeptidase MepM/ murein hydrolase activator NlpD
LALTLAVASSALTGCGDANLIDVVPSPSRYAPAFTARSEPTALLREWLTAAHAALADPAQIDLPYAVWGTFLGREPKASALQFSAGEGQVLRLSLARPEPIAAARVQSGKVDVDLYLVDPNRTDVVRPLPLTQRATADAAFEMRYRLPIRGRYVVSIRPEPSTDALYHLTLELDAALPFPVSGRRDGVSSFFGAPRDGGTRHHEGVDIFAPRMTPVLAVADGRATPRENHLGGHTVWLSTSGLSYYYAHLERAAVAAGQRVRRGDVLGYVGNTGNAITTDPHLHFGVYRWGHGAIDPLPLLESRHFDDADDDGDLDIEPQATQTFLRALCAAPAESRAAAPRSCGAPGAPLRGPAELETAYGREPAPLPAAGWRSLGAEAGAPPQTRRALPPEFIARGAILEVAREPDPGSMLCDALSAIGQRCSAAASRATAF